MEPFRDRLLLRLLLSTCLCMLSRVRMPGSRASAGSSGCGEHSRATRLRTTLPLGQGSRDTQRPRSSTRRSQDWRCSWWLASLRTASMSGRMTGFSRSGSWPRDTRNPARDDCTMVLSCSWSLPVCSAVCSKHCRFSSRPLATPCSACSIRVWNTEVAR
uniref:Secreted protein n=1 Tax=Ixodes ricinus TaxID=34613 RepID=A0A6B0UWB4_IXORI